MVTFQSTENISFLPSQYIYSKMFHDLQIKQWKSAGEAMWTLLTALGLR